MKNFTLECCVDSVESAIAAQKGGATRLELCADLPLGGTTPSPALLRQLRRYCDLPVNVLIRPRFGDFCYSSYELELMAEDAGYFAGEGANAIVIGMLTPQGELDMPAMKRVIAAAPGAAVTLHRAFDMCADPFATLELAVELGVSTILTSGQRQTAAQGAALLQGLVKAAGERLDILVGSGVSSRLMPELIAATGACCYHLSGKAVVESAMVYRNSNVTMGLPVMSEYHIWRTDWREIAAVREILENY